MSSTERSEAAAHALAKCVEFRAAMNSAKAGSRKWRDAEFELNFWHGLVATMLAKQGLAA